MRALLPAVAIVAALCLGCGSAWCLEIGVQPYAAQVVGIKTGGPDSNTWTYTVYNTSPVADYDLWLIAIEVDDAVEVVNAVSPAGWAADATSQPHFVSWICYVGEVGQGAFQTGFEATFSTAPVLQTYSAMFNNANTGEYPVDSGPVTFAPEPASMSVLVAGLMSVAALLRRRRAQ